MTTTTPGDTGPQALAHEQRTIDGHLVSGTRQPDGSFFSDDGTLYVDPGGKVEHGLTAPDGRFLPNGASRVVDGATVWGSVGKDGSFLSEDGTLLVTADGRVEHGKVVDGRFLVARTVDGRTVWGGETEDGGFISQDGTLYVDPGGKVEHGLTAPDGRFLPNGASRLVEGRTVWGVVGEDGSFLSEDGTLLVTADGRVEHGKVADGRFLVARTVDGRTVWGGETEDGGFISQDGTIYVDAEGNVQKGIVDPATNSFVPGGIAYTMPDGSTAYGVMAGDTFYTADGTTVVLGDGTVLRGTIDWPTGIFTTGSGDSYFIGENGVTHGKFRDADGAFVLDDGETVMTPKSWTVDLAQMADAITYISAQYDLIDTYNETISTQIRNVENAWSSPSGDSFSDVAAQVQSALDDLYSLVGQIADQMQWTYDNYVQAEHAAYKNLQQ